MVDLPFKVDKWELNFWELMNVIFLKYDELEDNILWKYIEEWDRSENIDTNNFKKFLNSKIYENNN
jgi:hypothetical protein